MNGNSTTPQQQQERETLVAYIFAAGTAALVNFPLWKATAIRQSGFPLPPGQSRLQTFMQAYKPPYRGVLGAWVGMTWARTAIFGGSEWGRRVLQERHGIKGVAASALPALVTAGTVQCINTPLFKATVAIQDPRSPHRGVWESLVAIYRSHGFRGLVHGTSAGVLKTAPKYGVAVLVRDQFDDHFKGTPAPGSRWEVLCQSAFKSVCAGLCSAVVVNPFDVLRNTMFKRPPTYTLRQTVVFLFQSEGPAFMVRGLGNNLLSVCLPIALTIFLTDVFKRLLLTTNDRDHGQPLHHPGHHRHRHILAATPLSAASTVVEEGGAVSATGAGTATNR